MKGRKKKCQRVFRLTMAVILVLIILGSILFAIIRADQGNDSKVLENTPSKNTALENTVFECELLEFSAKGRILKIDAITPSLDTCSFETILYDRELKKILSRTNFEDGAWVSGLTKNGFYAVNIFEKTAYLYDTNGTEVLEKKFSSDDAWSYACSFNDEETYFLYVDQYDGTVHLVDLETDIETTLTLPIHISEILSFEGSILKGIDTNDATFCVDVLDIETCSVIMDQRCSYHSANYSLGTTEYNFIYFAENDLKYIPFDSVDEMVVGMSEHAFATYVIKGDQHFVRVYALDLNEKYEMEVDEPVENVLMIEDEIYILIGDINTKQHKIVKTSYSELEGVHFDSFTEDKPKDEVMSDEAPETAFDLQANAKIIDGVPMIGQYPSYPTGCESVSTVMVMQYFNEDIDVDTFVEVYLPKSSEFYMTDGKKFGPSPYEYFIGHPASAASYGCMAPVIEKALIAYYGEDTSIKNISDTELDEICDTYIDDDIPVIIWATMGMKETEPTNSWYLSENKRYTWPGGEHCLVMIGYDDDGYYFNDPYYGQMVKYDKTVVRDRYAELGKQALVINVME